MRGASEIEPGKSAPLRTRIWLAIGPAGCGKSTLGAAIARLLGARCIDADAFHSEAAIAKMRAGIALDDADRAPWLVRFGQALAAETGAGADLVGACSALKRRYRDTLRALVDSDLILLCPEIDKSLLAQRLAARRDHFFAPSLLDSQLRDFEPPQSDERALRFPAGMGAEDAARLCIDTIAASG